MLQQTRIAAVLPYYHRFLARFPTVAHSRGRARRSAEVLGRPRLLQSRAQSASRSKDNRREHGGKFPHTSTHALALPGIGRYTAAAVLSIAYDVPLAVLDGNVARVLARLGAVRGDLREPSRGVPRSRSAKLLPSRAPATGTRR